MVALPGAEPGRCFPNELWLLSYTVHMGSGGPAQCCPREAHGPVLEVPLLRRTGPASLVEDKEEASPGEVA